MELRVDPTDGAAYSLDDFIDAEREEQGGARPKEIYIDHYRPKQVRHDPVKLCKTHFRSVFV